MDSLSGMHASPSTVGYNKSSHSSLTSLCRCATSYANSSNEKFLGGMRHYYAPTIIYNHLLTSMRSCNHELIEKVITDFNLHYPTTDEVMDLIRVSANNYWRNEDELVKIRNFVDKMTPAEKAGFAYVGDFYHFDKYNTELPQKISDLIIQIGMKLNLHKILVIEYTKRIVDCMFDMRLLY